MKIISTFTSFKPVGSPNPEIIIIGTAPGAKSLEEKKIYQDPRNCFWKIIADLYNNGKEFATYQEGVDCLIKNKIAVLDIYESGDREGSADANIQNATIIDLEEYLKNHPNIKKIVFNGKNAEAAYKKLGISGPTTFVAPSTSGAHTITYQEKLDAWREILL